MKPPGILVESALVERAMDEIYHSTKPANIYDIFDTKKLRGRPFVSFSEIPQMKFGDFVLILYEPKLRSQLVPVEYSREWAEANPKRAAYVVNGSRGPFSLSKTVLRDFLDPLTIDRTWAERELQSIGREVALNGAVKKLLVGKQFKYMLDGLRQAAVESGLMSPDDIVLMSGSGRSQRQEKKHLKRIKRRTWQAKHGGLNVVPVVMHPYVHEELVAALTGSDLPEDTRAIIRKASFSTVDPQVRFEVPKDDMPIVVALVRMNLDIILQTRTTPHFVPSHKRWLAKNKMHESRGAKGVGGL